MTKRPARVAGKATIKEVARLAGVSFKTVSRVMNNEPGVTEATRATVLQAAKLLNYQPNVSARQLRGSRSFLLALLYDASSLLLLSIQSGAVDRCRETGYHLIVEEASELSRAETVRRLQDLRVDGVMLAPPLSERIGLVTALQEAGLQYVLLVPDELAPDAASVRLDDERAARELVGRLIAMGHRDIAFIGTRGAMASHSERRRQGWISAHAEAGFPMRPELEVFGDFKSPSGEAAADALCQLTRRPTAIFAANDFMAMGCMIAAARHGLRVPEDLSIVGFDDLFFASVLSPALTTVRLPGRDIGRAAVDLLTARELAPEEMHVTVGFTIIERGSAAPPKTLGEAPRRRRRSAGES